MIDVVFLLLIFFLVTTTFVSPERQHKTTMKVQQQSASRQPVDVEPAVVDVVRINNKNVFQIGAVVTEDIKELFVVLEGFDNKSDGAFVRVSDEVPFGMAAQAINACKRAGFPLVSYVPLDEPSP
jgi:biopolymer transport protein ExbD